MSLKLGNIVKTAKSTLSSNIGDFMGTAKSGLAGIGSSLAKEAASSILGFNIGGDPVYNSPFPLGNEWVTDPAYTATIVFTDPTSKEMGQVSGYMPETISMSFGADFSSPLENIGEKLNGVGGGVASVGRMFGFKVSSNIFSMLLWSGSGQVELTLEMRFVALRDTYTDIIEPIRRLSALVLPRMDSFTQGGNGALQLGMVTPPGPTLEYTGSSAEDAAVNAIGVISNAAQDIGGEIVSQGKQVLNGTTTPERGAVSTMRTTTETVGGMFNQLFKDVRVKNNISVMLGEFCYLRSVVIKDVSPAYNIKCDEDGNWIDATVSVQISTFITPTANDIPSMVGFRAGSALNTSTEDLTKATDLFDTIMKEQEEAARKKAITIVPVTPNTSKLNVEPQTRVSGIYNNNSVIFDSIGKDAGLGSTVKKGTDFSLGMSSSEANIFKNTALMG
jgi:hypothetical protein